MATKKVTVRALIEAMRKNGYTQIQGSWVRYDEETGKKVVAGCAYGQAAVNLGVDALQLSDLLHNVIYYEHSDNITALETIPDVISYNDRDNLPLKEIADRIEEWAKKHRLLTASRNVEKREYSGN